MKRNKFIDSSRAFEKKKKEIEKTYVTSLTSNIPLGQNYVNFH